MSYQPSHESLTSPQPLKGICLGIISYFFISLISLFQKPLPTELPLYTVLFFQSSISLLLMGLHWKKLKKITFKKTQPFWIYAIRILSGLGCYAVLFSILKVIPIAEALLYQYTAALWMPFIMGIWFHTPMQKSLWFGILIGFGGLILVLKPTVTHLNTGVFLGVLCGILQAISVAAVHKLSRSEPIERIMLYYFLSSTVVTLPFVCTAWQPLTSQEFFCLLGVGVCTYLGQRYLTASLRYANPTTLSSISYTCILFSGLFAWIFWQETLSSGKILGMGLIILGCLLTVHLSKRSFVSSPSRSQS